MRRTIPAGLLVLAFSLLAGLPASAAHPHGKTTFQKHFRPNLKAKFRLAGGPNYTVQFFAGGTGLYYKPDPIVVQGTSVYVAYQNGTATDGSDGGNSTIVQYNLFGAVQAITQVKGHCDGMRWNPYTNTLWILVNNDANPALYTLA
ncbi:MAG TPA: hypothetical protein VKG44_10450, partial [Candidatus Baltobacteraceae bacterium]|nr:hypothetical protein [Candidatus Baltobacteraceae bacterium]